MYKDKDSKAWKMANDDKKLLKRKMLKSTFSIYKWRKVKNPYKYKEYKNY